jgi:hypothetical protein
MATTPTTNYSFGKPTVGGSSDVWGTELNTALDLIDTTIKLREDSIDTNTANIATNASDITATEVVADGALQRAGGVMTGRIDAKTSTLQSDSDLTATGAVALDMASAQAHELDLSGNITALTFTNTPSVAGSMFAALIEVKADGFTIVWTDVDRWAGGSAPTLSAGRDLILVYTWDGGTTWNAARVAQNIS